MMLFAIQLSDGSVSVMRVVDEKSSVENEIAKWPASHQSKVVGCHAIGEADVPADRTYRNAWVSDGKRIGHDMEKCRAVHRERMRAARAPKLAALDIAYQRADEMKDEAAKAAIAAQK